MTNSSRQPSLHDLFLLTHPWWCQPLRLSAPQFWDCVEAVYADPGNAAQSPWGSCNALHPAPRWHTAKEKQTSYKQDSVWIHMCI